MRPSKARFVTACQQALALGAVLAVLAPAANVVSLDVVGQGPGTPSQPPRPAVPAAVLSPDREPARVPTGEVEPEVREYDLQPREAAEPEETQPPTSRPRNAPSGRPQAADDAPASVLSKPAPVDGFGTVGVTWDADDPVADDAITIQVRTRSDDGWSEWSDLEYHDEHSPDPDSAEARQIRAGTDPLIVGEVADVQVRASAEGAIPHDLTLSVVRPGEPTATAVEGPEIDTADLAQDQQDPAQATGTAEADDGSLELQAGTYTPQPTIYSRAQWGADERLRDPSSLRYHEVHAGFVHHTVNANSYTRDQVPGMIRSIYAYHTQSKGWSDIGYNFLVDRFGRIWEGRYGGVARPVVGAHTLGYNDYAFAMSAIGNFETAQPSSAMLESYGRLMGWKLSLHGVAAASTRQQVGSGTFQAINGHRDAGSTACPGANLYRSLPTIRSLAAAYQRSWSGRQREVDVVSTAYPDVPLRRTSDGAGFVLPTQGMLRYGAPRTASAAGWGAKDLIVGVQDVTGDLKGDLLARDKATGLARIHPGTGAGTFGAGIGSTANFKGFDLVVGVGDLNRDGRGDLVGREQATGRLYLFRGRGDGTFGRVLVASGWASYDRVAGPGDLNGDGRADLVARLGSELFLFPGTGSAALGARVRIPGNWSPWDIISGAGDLSGDGRADLFVRNRSSGLGYVFPGAGNGTFGHWLGPFGNVAGVAALSIGGNLVNGGPADLVGRRGDALVVLPHLGTFQTSGLVRTGVSFAGSNLLLNVGDWDRDGDGDLVTRNSATGDLELRLNNGNGTLAAPKRIGTGFNGVGLLAAVGDMTGDGWPDLMGQPKGAAMRIYPGRGLNGLSPSYVAYGAISARRHVGVGLWDRDGAPDSLVRVGDDLLLYPGNGPGGLTDPVTLDIDLAPYDWVIGVSDVSGAGHPDLVVRERITGYLWVLPGRVSGFGQRRFLASGFGGFDLAG